MRAALDDALSLVYAYVVKKVGERFASGGKTLEISASKLRLLSKLRTS